MYFVILMAVALVKELRRVIIASEENHAQKKAKLEVSGCLFSSS